MRQLKDDAARLDTFRTQCADGGAAGMVRQFAEARIH
jgi:hypothetical protein